VATAIVPVLFKKWCVGGYFLAVVVESGCLLGSLAT